MEILKSSGSVFDDLNSKNPPASEIKEFILNSARDGENLELISLFAQGNLHLISDEDYKSLILDAIYIANLKGNDNVLKAIFKANKDVFSLIEDYTLDYQHIQEVYNDILGEVEES